MFAITIIHNPIIIHKEQRDVTHGDEKNVSQNTQDRHGYWSNISLKNKEIEESHYHHCDSKSILAKSEFSEMIIILKLMDNLDMRHGQPDDSQKEQKAAWVENAVVRTASLVTNSDGDKYDDVVDEDRAVGDVSVDGIGQEAGCLSEGHSTSPIPVSWLGILAGLMCPVQPWIFFLNIFHKKSGPANVTRSKIKVLLFFVVSV